MDFQTVINKRKMVRSFKPDKIPKEKLDRIIRNMFKGPSAGFSQGTEVLVIDDADQKEKIFQQWGSKEKRKATFTRWPHMEDAPVVLVVLSNKEAYLERYAEPDKGWTDKDESRWPVPFWHIDAGMAALLALLTVVDEELAAVFTGVPDPQKFRDDFGVPENYTPIGAILLGYPRKKDPKSPSLKRGRRPIEEIAHYNFWTVPYSLDLK